MNDSWCHLRFVLEVILKLQGDGLMLKLMLEEILG